MCFIEGVKGMKEFILGSPLASCPELDIIYKEEIRPSESISKIIHLTALHRAYKLIHKPFRRIVAYLYGVSSLKDIVSNSLEEMSFPQPNPAVYKKRIIFIGKLISHSSTRCVGKLIIFSHNKIFKGIIRVKTRICQNPFSNNRCL